MEVCNVNIVYIVNVFVNWRIVKWSIVIEVGIIRNGIWSK